MPIVIAFDGSLLSKLALVKAKNLAEGVDTKLIVVSVVPDDADYVAACGWNLEGDEFHPDKVLRHLHEEVVELAPASESRRIITLSSDPNEIADAIHETAIKNEADIVVFGRENAGQITQSVIGDPSKSKVRRPSPHFYTGIALGMQQDSR